MKKVALLGAALGLSAVMAGCGLISVPVTNPLGLEGVKTAAVALAGKNLSVQAATGTLSATATFADSSGLSSVPATPSSFEINLALAGLSSTGPVNGKCAAPTTSESFTASNIQVILSDVNAPSKTVTITATDYTFTGTWGGENYAVSNGTGGKLSLTPAQIVTALEILKNPGTGQNTAAVTMNLSAASDTLKGCTVQATFAAGSGAVKI